MDGHISQPLLVNAGARSLELRGDGIEDEVGIRDMDFLQGHIVKRDLKRKREEHDYVSPSEGSAPPFPLFEVRH